MKSTSAAPANIAFIKYWGKTDEELRIPANSSISMNLDQCFSITTVEFDEKYPKDSFSFVDEKVNDKEIAKVIKHLDRIRRIAKTNSKAKVVTKNNFPKGSGIASSASGFAALTVAGCHAAGLELSEKELSILARLGSGSACRSIPDGFVEWLIGSSSKTSYAHSLHKENYWELRDLLLIISQEKKKTGSTEGMENVNSSPFFNSRLKTVEKRIILMKKALANKNFPLLGETLEEDCINMHYVMMTQNPPLFYWNSITMEIIQKVQSWRQEGLLTFFTIDAGPNVHLICQAKDEKKVYNKAQTIKGIQKIIINKPAKGARIINRHLF